MKKEKVFLGRIYAHANMPSATAPRIAPNTELGALVMPLFAVEVADADVRADVRELETVEAREVVATKREPVPVETATGVVATPVAEPVTAPVADATPVAEPDPPP